MVSLQTIDGYRILSYYLMVVSKFYRDKLQHAIDPKIEKTIMESLVKQFTDAKKGMYRDATCICDNYRRNGVPDLEPDWSEFIQADERDAAPTPDTVFTIGRLKPTQLKAKFTPMPDPHGASTVTQKGFGLSHNYKLLYSNRRVSHCLTVWDKDSQSTRAVTGYYGI